MTKPSDNKKKRTCRILNFAILAKHRVKLKESEKRYKYRDLARELKKTMEHESDGNTNCNWHAQYSNERIGTKTGGVENKRTRGDYSIIRK